MGNSWRTTPEWIEDGLMLRSLLVHLIWATSYSPMLLAEVLLSWAAILGAPLCEQWAVCAFLRHPTMARQQRIIRVQTWRTEVLGIRTAKSRHPLGRSYGATPSATTVLLLRQRQTRFQPVRNSIATSPCGGASPGSPRDGIVAKVKRCEPISVSRQECRDWSQRSR